MKKIHKTALALGAWCMTATLQLAANETQGTEAGGDSAARAKAAEEKLSSDWISPDGTSARFGAQGSLARGGGYLGHGDGAELLRSQPGVRIGRMGGHGLEPSIRGQQQERIDVQVGGCSISGGCPNRMDPPASYAPAPFFDKVKVEYGPRSVSSPGGPGGAISYEQSPPELAEDKPWQFEAGGMANSNGIGRSGYVIGAAGTDKAFARARGMMGQSDDYNDGNGNEVRSSYFERAEGATLGFTPSEVLYAEIGADQARTEDAVYAGASMDSPLSEHNRLGGTLRLTPKESALQTLEATAHYASVDHEMDNYSLREHPMMQMVMRMTMVMPAMGMMPARTVTTTRTVEQPMMMRTMARSITHDAGVRAGIKHGEHLTMVGADYQSNNRTAHRFSGSMRKDVDELNSVVWPDVTTLRTGFFGETAWWLDDRSKLTTGLRYDRYNIEADDHKLNPAGAPMSQKQLAELYYGSSSDEVDEDHVTGVVRFDRQVFNENSTVYAGASRRMRTADPTERYMGMNSTAPSGRWIGDNTLDPEVHWQPEAGIRWQAGEWYGAAAAHYDFVDDFILRDRARLQSGVLQDDQAAIYRNADAEIWGLDGEIGKHWLGWINTGISASYVEGTNLDTGRPLYQIPPLETRVKLELTPGAWVVGTQLRLVARQSRTDDDPTEGAALDARKTPGFAVWDLYASCQITRQLKWSAGINNLLDTAYAEHLNRASAFDANVVQVNEPGFNVWTGFQAKF